MLLVFVVCLIGLAAAFRYGQYIKQDPAFCSLCHVMEEGYKSHDRGKHFTLICQRCHKLSVLEGNKLLMAVYVGGAKDIENRHSRESAWQQCMDCHGTAASQGSLTFRESFGHARHVFMHDIKCISCHSGSMHSFTVSAERCIKCHEGKLVHGMGTAGLSCLNCHNFAESSPRMVSNDQCIKCHAELKRNSGPMSHMRCNDCHHPHKRLASESRDCLTSCHEGQARVGEHGRHLEKSKLTCTDCHKPHGWSVGKAQAATLCNRCHKAKDPLTFIY